MGFSPANSLSYLNSLSLYHSLLFWGVGHVAQDRKIERISKYHTIYYSFNFFFFFFLVNIFFFGIYVIFI